MPAYPTLWSSNLDAHYELLEEAGRGGMGVVFKARDRETGEIVGGDAATLNHGSHRSAR